MNFNIKIEKKALKFIQRQDRDQMKRLLSAIYRLPHEGDRRPMEGYPGLFRLRVGAYRVIYTVNEGLLTVLVIDAGNRGEIYRRY